MARGITYFTGYVKSHTPGGTLYRCTLCEFKVLRQRGNALAMHNKTIATIKKHRAERHPEADPHDD